MSDKRPSKVTTSHAPGEHHADTDPAKHAIHAGFEFSEYDVHSDDSPCSSNAGVADEQRASEDALRPSAQHHFTQAKHVVAAKQCDPSALFRLSSFGEPVRTALDFFLRRHAKRKWMQAQKLYVPKAALAAAHEAMHPVFEDDDDDGRIERFRNVETSFDALGFLKCGIPVRPRKGFPARWKCGQVEWCPRCNLDLRVKPAKYEFLPALERAIEDGKAWSSITVIGRSNPRNSGVKVQIGRDSSNKPIYRPLFRPSDHCDFPKLSKFGVDDVDCRSQIVGEALHEFMNWLTDGKYFDGLHVFRDLDFTFFPDAHSSTGVGHTANCHFHGYGNSSRRFTSKEAQRMWFGCVNLLRKFGGGELAAYPDIALHPLPTLEALETAINYVIKPFKFAHWYLEGLKHGCPVVGLNQEFFQTAFGTEALLCATKEGSVFGNMSQKSGHHYIGKPPPVILKRHQVRRFLERQAADEACAWEYERYQNHLKLITGKNRKQRQPAQ